MYRVFSYDSDFIEFMCTNALIGAIDHTKQTDNIVRRTTACGFWYSLALEL